MDILVYSIKSVSHIITNPTFLFVLFIMGMVLHSKNKKSRLIENMILGSESYSALELTISQIVMGIIGGVIATVFCTYLGIVFKDGSAIIIMFLISMILMIINPKLLCFSYSGAVLGLLSLINMGISEVFLTNPIAALEVNIVSLVALVGVLHIVEGLMVFFDGYKGALPVFTKREEKTIGGFVLNRYYTLPMALLIVLINDEFAISSKISIGSWWPLLNGTINERILGGILLSILPVLAIVGYNSVTFTKSKKAKSMTSGFNNIVFGVTMILLSQVASKGIILKVLIIILMPLLHELMLIAERKSEVTKKPKYFNEDNGIRVLEVGKNSIAQKLGIKSGDIILAIDGEIIEDEIKFSDMIKSCGDKIKFRLKRENGIFEDLISDRIRISDRFGTIFVPKRELKGEKINFKDVMKNIINDKNKDN